MSFYKCALEAVSKNKQSSTGAEESRRIWCHQWLTQPTRKKKEKMKPCIKLNSRLSQDHENCFSSWMPDCHYFYSLRYYLTSVHMQMQNKIILLRIFYVLKCGFIINKSSQQAPVSHWHIGLTAESSSHPFVVCVGGASTQLRASMWMFVEVGLLPVTSVYPWAKSAVYRHSTTTGLGVSTSYSAAILWLDKMMAF